jgi:hypothetical protein
VEGGEGEVGVAEDGGGESIDADDDDVTVLGEGREGD